MTGTKRKTCSRCGGVFSKSHYYGYGHNTGVCVTFDKRRKIEDQPENLSQNDTQENEIEGKRQDSYCFFRM